MKLNAPQDNLFPLAPPGEVSALYGRTFATWTAVTCFLTAQTAYQQPEPSSPLFLTTLVSFILAGAHFSTELIFFETMTLRSVASSDARATRTDRKLLTKIMCAVLPLCGRHYVDSLDGMALRYYLEFGHEGRLRSRPIRTALVYLYSRVSKSHVALQYQSTCLSRQMLLHR